MRTEHLLISLGALLISFFLIACGLFLLIFPEATFDFRTIGIASMSMGALLLLVFFLTSRRRYLLIKMGGVAIHERVVQHCAKEALQGLFPKQAIECDVIIMRKGKVEILANIPYLSEEKREQKLQEIETVLGATLLKYCGCKGSFIFNVSFSRSIFSS